MVYSPRNLNRSSVTVFSPVNVSPDTNESPSAGSIIDSGSLTKKKGRHRSYQNKVVVHDIFMKCAEIEKDDVYWRDVFIDAAYGKFLSQPYYVKDGVLIYSKGTTVNQLKLTNDAEKLSKECIAFFQNTGGYHSRKDLLNDRAKRSEFEKSIIASVKKREWNNYSTDMRKYMITKYVEQKTKEFNLEQKEQDALYDLLVTGIALGYMCKATVTMNYADNLIEDATCIKWDSNSRKFYFDNVPKSKQIPTTQNKLMTTYDIANTAEKANIRDSFVKKMGKYFDYSNLSGKKARLSRYEEKARILEAIQTISPTIKDNE